MALKIYPSALPDNPYSQSGNMTNPLRQAFDGRQGGVSETKYYIRNDESSYIFSGIQVFPVDQVGDSITDGTSGFSWKLKEGDTQPLDAEWEVISPGNTVTLGMLSDTGTYLPFWLRIEIPRSADVESYDDVILRTIATKMIAP